MNFWSTSRGLLSLIIGSLTLLGVFIGFWLYKVYQEEKSLLEKESGYMVSNAINEYESEVMHAFVTNLRDNQQDSINISNGSFQIMMTTTRDSIHHHHHQEDTSVHIQMAVNNHATFHPLENISNDIPAIPRHMIELLRGD